MNKWKARLCITLFIIAIAIILTGSFFVKNTYGVTLYQIIISSIAYIWIGEHIEKFYLWLIRRNNNA